MFRVAGVFPRKIHPTTWVAALTLASVCVAGALWVGEQASAYLPGKVTITSWRPPSAGRELAPREPSQTSNLARKTAREPFRQHEARAVPKLLPIDPSRLGATRRAPQDEAERAAPQDEAGADALRQAPQSKHRASAETGRASWYDLETPTASGETLDDGALTAAHRTYPFGTRLRVTNLKNGREVVVRVNDRGPFAKDRIIDLSKAAASELGMIADGVADVSIAPVADMVARNAGAGG